MGLSWVLGFATQPPDRFTQGGLPHGDGLYHYAQVRSLVLDGDLRLANDYARLGNPHGQPVRADGWAGNHFTVGTALVWVPSFVVAHGLSRLGDAAGWWQDPGDGSSARCRRLTMLGSVVAGWLALLLMARRLRGSCGPRAVGLSVVLAAVATPLHWYVVQQPSWSHAASAFAVAGLVHATAVGGPHGGAKRGLVVGLWIGLVALVRPQDLVFAIGPLALGSWGLARSGPRRQALVGVVVMLAVAALVFAPQAWVWQHTYGRAWLVPQGPGFMRWADSQWNLVLWSSRGGLLPWSPAVGLSLVGLAVAVVRGPARGLARWLALALVLEIFVCGAVDDWWGGWAFGARRLVSATVVFGFGWAVLLHSVLDGPRRRVGSCMLVAALSLGAVRFSARMRHDYQYGVVQRGVPQSLAPVWSRAFGLPLDGMLEVTGTPGSWPASWVFAWRSGAPPGRYDLAVGWALVRARGDAKGYERLWATDPRWALSGLGPEHARGQHRARMIEDRAILGVPLRGPMELDGRLRLWAAEATRIGVDGWGEPVVLMLRPGWHDYPLERARQPGGTGLVQLRRLGSGEVEVAWLDVFEPGRDPMKR
ncbi:MAG: hypothetical protein AB1Z98_06250 [Nannocystaceae bacterium]